MVSFEVPIKVGAKSFQHILLDIVFNDKKLYLIFNQLYIFNSPILPKQNWYFFWEVLGQFRSLEFVAGISLHHCLLFL